MKILIVISTLTLLSPVFAFAGIDKHENMIVTAPDLSGGGGGLSTGGGNPVSRGGPSGGGSSEGRGGSGATTRVGGLKRGDIVKDGLGGDVGKILQFFARDFDAAGEIWVKVETPDGYKIEVRITAQAKVTGRR